MGEGNLPNNNRDETIGNYIVAIEGEEVVSKPLCGRYLDIKSTAKFKSDEARRPVFVWDADANGNILRKEPVVKVYPRR